VPYGFQAEKGGYDPHKILGGNISIGCLRVAIYVPHEKERAELMTRQTRFQRQHGDIKKQMSGCRTN
jgi:hypothetical protein